MWTSEVRLRCGPDQETTIGTRKVDTYVTDKGQTVHSFMFGLFDRIGIVVPFIRLP